MPHLFALAMLAAFGGPQEATAPQALDLSSLGASITTRSVVLVAVTITTVSVAVATARAVATRCALRRRVAYALWPTDTFDPQPEEVVRVAAQLSRTRLAVFGLLVRRATAIRIRLQSTDDGELLYVLEGPARARSLLRSLGFDEVEVRSCEPAEPDEQAPPDPKSESEPTPKRRLLKARAELELALTDTQPLREVPLRPDPLTPFAHAMGELRGDLGESASVVIDLMPVTQSSRRRMVRRAIDAERSADGSSTSSGFWDQVKVGLGESSARSRPTAPRRPHALSLEGAERRAEHRAVSTKLVGHDPAFHIQVLVRTASVVRGRPEAHLRSLLSAFDIFGGQNYLRARGRRIGPWFFGADTPGRRLWFDRRLDGGLFRPGKRTVVTARELLGLLKPPTVHCRPMNVVRSGGLVPPPPRGLPEFRYQHDVLPLGTVSSHDGDRPVGTWVRDINFAYMSGRAGYGKTETAINQFIHLARAGHGCFFLDHHEDALARIKPYLTDVADRVVEVNLAAARSRGRQAGWNLFSMEGLAAEHIESRVSAVADSFGSVLRWSEQNNRALSITTRAAESLCHLALLLPPEKAPTIFQISTLLSNDEWRKGVVGFLPPTVRDYWENRYPRLASDASTAVSNLVDRLSSSAAVSALLGSSRSTYRIRQCMDEGKIVLACPAGVGDKDRLVAGFLVFDLLQAALSRKDTPAKDRRPFYCWFDEVQTYDGASRGNLAALLEQARKYRVVAFLLNQNPDRLTEATYDAVTTNTSLLATTVVNAEAAVKLANQWGKAVDPKTITRLDKYTYLASVTIGTELSRPFRVRGFEVGQLWADHHYPEKVAELETTVDATMGRRPLAEAIRHLEGLDEAILEHLQSLRGRPRLHVVGEEDDGDAPAMAGGPRRRSERVRWSDLET